MTILIVLLVWLIGMAVAAVICGFMYEYMRAPEFIVFWPLVLLSFVIVFPFRLLYALGGELRKWTR